MNHVWSPVVMRASHAAPKAPSTCCLRLLRSLIRDESTTSPCTVRKRNLWTLPKPWISSEWEQQRRSFGATSAWLARRRLRSTEKNTHAAPASISAAPTVASHTDGVVPTGGGELTWRDYDPVGGMPLPVGDLGREDMDAVFGADMDVDTGNYILNVMHYRRLSGQLIDAGLSFPKDSGVTPQQAMQGLEYVRQMEPDVNEEENGNVWAEEETKRIEAELLERAQSLGIYKRQPEAVEEDEEQGTEEGRQRTGESMLIKQRTQKEAQREVEEAERQVQQDRQAVSDIKSQRGPLELSGGVQPSLELITTDTGGIAIRPPPKKAWLAPVQRKPWVRYWERHAQILKTHTIPQMSMLQRLGPAFLVLVASLGAALYLSSNYTPPDTRMFPSYSPAMATVGVLTALLFTTFIAARLPPFWRTLNKYLTLIPAYPYAFSILGSSLRHDHFSHLVSNLVILWGFAPLLHSDIGRGNFLAILLASAATAGFATLSLNVYRHIWTTYIFGASNALLGISAAACVLHPWGRIEVAGVEVPLTAWLLLAGYFVLEVRALVGRQLLMKGQIDHMGHVAGMVTGIAAGFYFKAKGRDREGLMERVEAAKEHVEEALSSNSSVKDNVATLFDVDAVRREGGSFLWSK